MDYFEAEGRWWLPSDPDRSVVGKLTFDSGGIWLRLDGFLWVEEAKDHLSPVQQGTVPIRRERLVHGLLRSGTDITLIDVLGPAGSDSDFSENSTVVADCGLLGIAALEDSFDEIWFDLDHLEAWWNPPPIVTAVERSEFRVATSQADLAEVSLEKANLRIVAGVAGTQGGSIVDLRRSMSVRVQAQESLTIKALVHEYAQPMQGLLMFCLGEAVSLKDIRLIVATPGSERTSSARVFFKQVAGDRRELTASSIRSYASRTIYAVGDPAITPELLIERWYGKWEALGRGVSLLNAPIGSPFMFQETACLFAFQAAESTARALGNTKELSPEDHQARVDALSSALEASDLSHQIRQRAVNLFKRNDRPLADIVNDLAASVGIDELLGASSETFGRKASQLRGQAAHPGRSAGIDLRHWTTQLLTWTVRMRILTEMFSDPDEVRKKVISSYALASIVQRFKWAAEVPGDAL
jgi:hypothetical protein